MSCLFWDVVPVKIYFWQQDIIVTVFCLAPITATLIADLMLEQKSDPLLAEFSYQRFYQPANMTSLSNPKLPLQIESNSQPPLSAASSLVADSTIEDDNQLTIAGRTFNSRLMTGTGKIS